MVGAGGAVLVAELQEDVEGFAVAGFGFAVALLVLGEDAELVVGAGGVVLVAELQEDVEGFAVAGLGFAVPPLVLGEDAELVVGAGGVVLVAELQPDVEGFAVAGLGFAVPPLLLGDNAKLVIDGSLPLAVARGIEQANRSSSNGPRHHRAGAGRELSSPANSCRIGEFYLLGRGWPGRGRRRWRRRAAGGGSRAAGTAAGSDRARLMRLDGLAGVQPVVQGGGQVGVLGAGGGLPGGALLRVLGCEQHAWRSVAGECLVELVVGLAGGGLQGGLVVQAAAQEIGQHRLDLDQVAELGVRGGQADSDRLIEGGGQVDRAQLLDCFVLEEQIAVVVQDLRRWG